MYRNRRLVLCLLAFCMIVPHIFTAQASNYMSNFNAQIIYAYLRDTMGLNSAGCAAVLANIKAESNFNPNDSYMESDGYRSYGICQWHKERDTALQSYCSSHGYNYTSLNGQLHYFEYELKNSYYSVYNTLRSVANSSQGAYDAASYFCINFERPANMYVVGAQRGEVARQIFAEIDIDPDPASNFRFIDVTYPKTFKIDTTYGWSLGSGIVESNYTLTSIRSEILNSSGGSVSDSGVKSISGYSYSIKSLDDYSGTNNGVRFSWISSAGNYTWRLTATDSGGRTLVMDMPFTAVDSGSTITATMSKEYDNTPQGTEMSTGYDQTIADGDYIIAVAADPLYYLDIDGIDVPASNNTNVSLYHADSLDAVSDPDVWTVTYNSSNKFYTIKQKGTDMCLDVSGDGMALGKNVQVYSMNSQGANDKTCNWAISQNGTNGYRLQARCSGYSLSIAGGQITSGANVEQSSGNGTDAQTWTFIPYGSSKPIDPIGSEMTIGYDRTISDGDYIIAVASDPLYYLDIDGIDVPAGNNTNVLLYHTDSLDNISDPDVWTITYNSSDKFYTIRQKGTDMCLDVSGDGMALGKNVQVYSMNSQAANNKTSNWAISKNNTNGYRLQARCSGFSLDIAGGRITNGANVQQYSGNETELQSWTFIPYGSVKPTEDVTGIILSQKYVEKDYLMGSTFRLRATLEPESAKDSAIFWSSSNPEIASVDNGLVTIRSAGYVQILAHTENDVWAACEVLIHPDKISILPKGLSIIAEEAWMGTSLKEVIIPEGVTSIESRAFANCPDLLIVRIPTSTVKIAEDAFDGSDFATVIRWPYDN